MRWQSTLEKNRWPIPRLRTDLATGIVFSSNCRVPCRAIRPSFAPPILMTSEKERRGWTASDGDERIFEETRLGRTAMTKEPKGDTESPYDDCCRLSRRPFSSILPSSPFTPRILSSFYGTRFVQRLCRPTGWRRKTADKPETRWYVSFLVIINYKRLFSHQNFINACNYQVRKCIYMYILHI